MSDITDDLLIQQIYVSYFNRPADTFGLAYWKSIFQAGLPISAIANAFSASSEFKSIYSGTSIEKIGLLYKNMFNRTADFDGLLYWTNLLDSGSLSFQQIVSAFSNASGSDREAFQARVGAAQRFTASLDTKEEIAALQEAAAAKIAKDWFAGITDDASAQIAIGQLGTITYQIVEAAKPPAPTPPPAPAPPPPPQYSFTAQAGATPAALSFINSNVSNQTFSAISGLSPLNSIDTLNISFNNGGNSLSSSQTLNVGQLNLNSAGIVNLNTTNGVGSSGAATFSGITDTGLTSLSITSPSSGPLTLGTITAGGLLTRLDAENVSGFLTATFASGSFATGDAQTPNILGALGGGDYNLGNPLIETGIRLNGPTNIVRYDIHTTSQQVYVGSLTTNATIYGFGSASALDYLKIDPYSTANIVLDNNTHLNDVFITVQGSSNLTITGLKGGDNIWVDAPSNLNATATGAWTPAFNTANDGSASINANGNAINLQDVLGNNGWTITNSGAAASLVGSSQNDTISGGSGADTINGAGGVDTVNYSSALKSDSSSLATSDIGITLTLNGGTVVTLNPGVTNAGADNISNVENVIGTNGIDTITGDSNDNTIYGGTGADTINGAGGYDTVDYSSAVKSNGSALATSDIGITLTLYGGTVATLNPGVTNAGADNISNVESVIGTDGIDIITGDSNNNLISGGDGADIISGREGGDIIQGNEGNDLIYGWEGDDILDGDDGDDILDGSSGVDVLHGGDGSDYLFGGSEADGVYGDNDNDTFVYDTITDFIASNAIVDSIDGGNGIDAIRIDQASAFTIAGTDSFARARNVEILYVGAANTRDISITLNANAFTTADPDDYTADITAVTLVFDTNSSGNNTINAASQSSGAISLNLTGSAGQDTITGGAGDDTIDGAGGNDSLTGNGGADILIGGSGADTFNYTGNQSSGLAQTGNAATGTIDVITDFTTGVDKINLQYSGSFGGFIGTGQANSDYSSAYNHATASFAVQPGNTYIVEAYGSGSTWTSVLFASDLIFSDGQNSPPNPRVDGAIQIGTVGAYSTSTAALAAIVSSDVIGAL